MVSLNKVMLIGNVGNDPEMRFTPNGNPVTSFRVATNRIFTTAEGEKKQETDWFNIVTWNKLAEQCNRSLTKGRLVYVEGRLHTHSWDNPDGQKRYRTDVIAERVTFWIASQRHQFLMKKQMKLKRPIPMLATCHLLNKF